MSSLHIYTIVLNLPTGHQVTNLRDEVARVRQVLTNKDEESAESIQKAGADLQKASLKLFEVAYKKMAEEREGGGGGEKGSGSSDTSDGEVRDATEEEKKKE
ncbi:Stress-70 protein, mitochondrial [Geodia barretti]|uniref:Stress-70 protein, mitochondrial n=1 Tax=Geodia barretti TaxID=519541 RepID=A0AA35W4I6_GEOBA|nr:Stress-70 protein, mitochondrial [Geodia barretti]